MVRFGKLSLGVGPVGTIRHAVRNAIREKVERKKAVEVCPRPNHKGLVRPLVILNYMSNYLTHVNYARLDCQEDSWDIAGAGCS